MTTDDELQSLWRSQSQPKLDTEEIETMTATLQQDHTTFEKNMHRRDWTEVAAAAFVTVVAIAVATTQRDWGWGVLAVCCVFVGASFIVERRRSARFALTPDDSLRQCAERSLASVEHQIALLRGVWTWYLGPIALGMVAVIVSAALRERRHDPISMGVLIFVGAICAAVVVAVGLANHRAVKNQLEPQREKLKTFLATFEESP